MIPFSRPIIVIAGATASNKSSLALQLAKDINGVIINGDSRQIYKELQIGTAKPKESEMGNIPHYLYGHVSVNDNYNIYQYQKDVDEVLKILDRGQTPIIVGGTGLYIDSIIFNYKLTQAKQPLVGRSLLQSFSVSKLQSMIPKDVFLKLNNSDRANPVRLVRIIQRGNHELEKGETLNALYFVIDVGKKDLKQRIEKRVNKMFKQGLLDENISLRKNNLYNSTVKKIIGYREFDEYFESIKTLEQVKNEIINNTKKYAKRQRTWFRRNKNAIWTNSYDLILDSSTKFITTE